MARFELHALSGLRGEAAVLLADRYARQREHEPLLPDVDYFVEHVPEDGLAATSRGEVVAYLSGTVDGETARVGFAGHAASDPEALRELFAAMAERWGVSRFSIAVPAADVPLVNVWFRLAFGCQFIWAVREAEEAEPVDFGGTIRLATPDDVEALAGFDELLGRLQQRSPSFSGWQAPTRLALRDEWLEVWAEPGLFHPFVAERDGRVVGHALLYARPGGDLRVPEGNIDLADAATLEDVRGSGVGLALTHHVLRWAHEHEYRSVTIDWRSVNLLSSRFWPRRGFRAQYLRLYRAVP